MELRSGRQQDGEGLLQQAPDFLSSLYGRSEAPLLLNGFRDDGINFRVLR
jgi:hypothetical protein